jgi:C-terminal processing protease CtpA/Prc
VALVSTAAILSTAQAETASVRTLRDQAQTHERNGEWDKALSLYGSLIREHNTPEAQDRYQHCLRRYWQGVRHQDESYRKEVLSLDYGQALRLYSKIRDVLLDNAVDRKKLDPGRLLKKGLEELDAALAHPVFRQLHLPGRQAEIQAFREHVKRTYVVREPMTRAQVERQVRDIALAAQDMLQLNTTVTILELACGASYAIDDYTAYLTPHQFRQLCDALKGEASDGMPIASVFTRLESGSIGYVRILSFQDTTLQELDEALNQLAKAGVRGLVLDLRGNPGGLVEVAIESARRFLAGGVVATVENQDPKFSTVYHARGPAVCTVPMNVLVDGDTASAAEVLAGALKENDRARVIGQTTFGKGCTQSLVKLPAANGVPTGGLRVTVARFFSPRGQAYTGRGVTPHVVVPRFKPDDMMAPGDYQFEVAFNDLQRQLR